MEALAASRREYLRQGPESIRQSFGEAGLPALHLVVMGDSASIGVGTDPEHSFSWLVAQRLSSDYRVDLAVIGESGARTKDVATEQLPRALSLRPDIAIVEIGANDTTHLTSLGTVRKHMRATITALNDAGIEPVVVGPPHMGTSRAFAQPLRALSGFRGSQVSRTIEKEARRGGVIFVDLAAATGRFFKDDPEAHYSKDMFHPNAAGYARWADAIVPAVRRAASELDFQPS